MRLLGDSVRANPRRHITDDGALNHCLPRWFCVLNITVVTKTEITITLRRVCTVANIPLLWQCDEATRALTLSSKVSNEISQIASGYNNA
jgi:hypothetical protein